MPHAGSGSSAISLDEINEIRKGGDEDGSSSPRREGRKSCVPAGEKHHQQADKKHFRKNACESQAPDALGRHEAEAVPEGGDESGASQNPGSSLPGNQDWTYRPKRDENHACESEVRP